MKNWHSQVPETLKNEIQLKDYQAGEVILYEGDKGDKVCFLLTGCAKIYVRSKSGQIHIQNIVEAPEAFGMIELFKDLNNVCSVEAYSRVSVMMVNKEAFFTWLKLDHSFALEMLSIVSDIAYRQIDEQSKSIFYPLKYRFISLLITEIDARGKMTLVFDKQILAQRLATTLRHLNRTINTLVELGFLSYEDGKINVLDLEALKAYKDV